MGSAVFALRFLPWATGAIEGRRQRVLLQAELLNRARADLLLADALVDSGSVLQARVLELAPRILSGSSEAAARADLAGRLHAAAARHRIRLDRSDMVPDSARAGALRSVTTRTLIEGDSQGTLELLQALGQGEVVLTLGDLRVMALDPSSPDAAPEVLRTELTVQGWFLQRDSIP
jgi:hypothetical protein